MTAAWILIGASAACCAAFGLLLYVFGRGPDREVNSIDQPRLFWLLFSLLLVALVLVLAGLDRTVGG